MSNFENSKFFTAVHTGHRFTVTGKKARHSMARKQPVLGPSPVTEVPEGPGYLWSTAVVDGRGRRPWSTAVDDGVVGRGRRPWSTAVDDG